MISSRSFSKEWLLHVNKTLGWNRQEVQLKNMEKAIAALYLLECLKKESLDFIFKGGTSLLLLLGKIYRLSVDVDILVEKRNQDFGAAFSRICSSSELFYRYEKQIRDTDMILKTEHYKFYYRPFADDTGESYILLDLYCAENPYARTSEVMVAADMLDTDGENISVLMPDADCLLADKLTAFAPTTIGIPLSARPGKRPKRIEVLKQMYDIGKLFDLSGDVRNIHKTYFAAANHEIAARGLGITAADVLKDTSHYANIIGHRGRIEKDAYDLIAKGYGDFRKFVADMTFNENQAVLSAAKIAYLVSVLLYGKDEIEKYDGDMNMSDWKITGKELSAFNDYKLINPEAFFYWVKSIE
jgi:hypothetical protein